DESFWSAATDEKWLRVSGKGSRDLGLPFSVTCTTHSLQGRRSCMRPRISIITLGVDDLERALTFYRDGLGLPTRGIVGTEYPHGAVVFFDLVNGQKLAVWSRKDMAHEAKVPLSPRSATECSLGHLVRSKAEVDALIEQAKRAG